jgi:hypothetical protein
MAQRPTAQSTGGRRGRARAAKGGLCDGAGRSGSTILGVALGNCETFFYAGELDKWLMSGVSDVRESRCVGERRGCGSTALEPCARAGGGTPGSWQAVRRLVETSSALFRVHGWRARRGCADRIGVSRRISTARSQARPERSTSWTALAPSLRARRLQSIEASSCICCFWCAIHGAWSRPGSARTPEPRFSMLATNAYLWLTNLLSVCVFLRHPRERQLFIRYGDFTANRRRPCVASSTALVCRRRSQISIYSGRCPYHGNRLIFPSRSLKRATPPHPRRSSPGQREAAPVAVGGGSPHMVYSGIAIHHPNMNTHTHPYRHLSSPNWSRATAALTLQFEV